MQQNNNTSVLPFYTDIEEQNHRKSYAFGDIYKLITPAANILPFQIIRPRRATSFLKVQLYTCDGGFVAEITEKMKLGGLRAVTFGSMYNYDVITYPAMLPISDTATAGMYYIVVNDGVQNYYSDIFTWVTITDNLTKIEWYDEEDFLFEDGRIVYKNPRFLNRVFFPNEIGKPEYTFEEEGNERDGLFFPEKQISAKTYKINVLAPEYLCDVMRFIRMADHVQVTDKYGRKYDCDQFLISPKWETQGNIASVEIEFKTDTIAKKIGLGYIIEKKGDFNEDYNQDYLTKTI